MGSLKVLASVANWSYALWLAGLLTVLFVPLSQPFCGIRESGSTFPLKAESVDAEAIERLLSPQRSSGIDV
jgi:hypothetical protein